MIQTKFGHMTNSDKVANSDTGQAWEDPFLKVWMDWVWEVPFYTIPSHVA